MAKPIKHNIIGEQAWHVFEKDGLEYSEECTVAEYDALALPNAPAVKKTGYVWKFSFKDWKYDTANSVNQWGCIAGVTQA